MGRKRLGAAAAARKRKEEDEQAKVTPVEPVLSFDLKKGDRVWTVPSTKYPESVILVVDKIIPDGTGGFLIYFVGRKTASEYAKSKNLGKTFVKINDGEE
jgi:hypothetical protein